MRNSHLIGGSGGLVCYGTFGPGSGLPMVCCWLECDIVWKTNVVTIPYDTFTTERSKLELIDIQ